jgi:hypothetical protein
MWVQQADQPAPHFALRNFIKRRASEPAIGENADDDHFDRPRFEEL